ncbi:MAG: type pili twitching motility protein PilT [Myxococcales bacterium]|nr:type pili twitching motility protein PilT [Myxococcales bacterium]
MSAIVSLLKVMTLRDAEAMVLEAGKIPNLRRKGQVEALAMPALDPQLIAEFAAPLLEGKSIDDGPLMVTFVDGDSMFPVTIERVPAGLRMVVRKPANKARPSAPAPVRAAVVEHEQPEVARPAPRAVTDSSAAHRQLARLLATPLAIARDRGASDLLLSTGQTARIRVDGRLETIDVAIDDGELVDCVSALATDVAGVSADFSLEIEGTRLRVNAFDHLGGHAIAARIIRDRIPSLTDLELPPELAGVVELRDGLVLVCGPTGSGKSTTLAALIDLLDQRRAAHVITLEDPIEYRFPARRCLIHQRELGTHIPSFAAGLRAALREIPDVILLGELRDPETIAAALTAAETGHLVLATLHAPNAAGAIDRVIDAFPDTQQRQIRQQLAAALRIVITQFLLPRRDGGRAPAIEFVPVTAAVANIIRKGDLHTLPTAIQSGREAGMIPLERSLAKLLDSGSVSPVAIRRIAADHDLLAALSSKLR